MSRVAIITGLSILVAGCAAGPQVKTYTGPTGETVHTVRCIKDPSACFQEASKVCGAPYRVTSSYRNAGGLLADYFPGPVTWYTMDVVCGYADGVQPTFPLRGQEPSIPASTYVPRGGSGTVNCYSNTIGNQTFTNCY